METLTVRLPVEDIRKIDRLAAREPADNGKPNKSRALRKLLRRVK